MVIVTSPLDVAEVYKNTTLTHDVFVRSFFSQLGLSTEGMRKMFQDPRDFAIKNMKASLLQSENPLHKNFSHFQSDLYQQQLHTGKRLNVLQAKFLQYINGSLQWDKLPSGHTPSSAVEKTVPLEKVISLSQWCREVLVNAATRSLFGDAPLEIDPNFLQYFYDFDGESWKLLYQVPYFLAKDAHAVKDKILDVLVQFVRLRQEQKEDACWLIKTLEKESKYIGLAERDIAAMLLIVYWV